MENTGNHEKKIAAFFREKMIVCCIIMCFEVINTIAQNVQFPGLDDFWRGDG